MECARKTHGDYFLKLLTVIFFQLSFFFEKIFRYHIRVASSIYDFRVASSIYSSAIYDFRVASSIYASTIYDFHVASSIYACTIYDFLNGANEEIIKKTILDVFCCLRLEYSFVHLKQKCTIWQLCLIYLHSLNVFSNLENKNVDFLMKLEKNYWQKHAARLRKVKIVLHLFDIF